MAKILILDIETSPTVAYVWRAWKENISNKQILKESYIMSFAAKWLDKKDVIYFECRDGKDKKITEALLNLLDEAEIVIAHNGERFDFPRIHARALRYNIKPTSPYKVIDTLKVARKEFGFMMNSLEHLCEHLNIAKKGQHEKFPGFSLWKECLSGNEDAWREMKKYNIQDIYSLEELYLRMRPWIRNHPNVSVFEENEKPQCPKCASTFIHFRGFAYTNVGKYHRFQCQLCGGWGRSRYTEKPKEYNKNIMANAVS